MHQRFVRGRLLVKFKDGVSEERARALMAEKRARTTDVISQIGVHIIELPPNADEEEILDALKARSEVEFAELDQVLLHQSITPNDDFFPLQRHLPLIQAPDAWATTTGVSLTVALIDTGVFSIHPDLQSKLVPGWDIFDNASNTKDVTGQGTWAAGVIGASTNNGFGVAGICWGCLLMPVRVSDTSGNATVSNIASGISWAADHGAKIANLGFAATDSPTVSSAAQYLWNKGGITVAPSGNNGTFDASPNNPYILTVGGTDAWTDSFWSLSNTGNNLDLMAPNFSSYTTLNGGGYGGDSGGTCISAAMVSGVAALVWSVNSSLSPAQVTNILEQSADQKSGTQGTWNSTYGWGRVNAFKAVTMASGAGAKTTTTTTVTSGVNPSSSGQLVTFTATVSPWTATGSVTFSDGSMTIGTAILSGGRASFATSSLSTGSHSITAGYGGDTNDSGSTSAGLTQTVQIVKANTTITLTSTLNPSASGQPLTFTATVAPSSATGAVTFLDGGAALGSSTLSSGKATFTTSSLAVGSHSITASYGGDSNDTNGVSGVISQTVTVNKASTTVAVASSLNPSKSGQTVMFTATVSPSSATGAVTFLDGGAALGSSTLSGGMATFTTSGLAAGSHAISVSYTGDGNDNSSVSPQLTQTVTTVITKAATITGISSNLNPATSGQTVTFTGTVTPSSATGAVTFFDGNISLGAATLSGGVATLSTSSLAVGSHSITGAYSGDNNYNSSTSGAMMQTVNLVTTLPPASCPSPGSGVFAGCYFNNISLSGTPAFVRTDNQINFYWGSTSPDKSLTPDNFSVRWQGYFTFSAGTHTFVAATSDGMRVYIDGSLVLDQWRDQSTTGYLFSETLSQGQHLVVVEYYDHTNQASASLWWW